MFGIGKPGSISDPDGQDARKVMVTVDQTILDKARVQRVVSARNAGRRSLGEVGKRFLTGTVLRTNAAELAQTT